jgi:Condensation domain
MSAIASAPGSNLTDRQLLIWMEHQLGPQLPSRNMVATFRVQTDVDVQRFQRCFDQVVADSAVLRTVFENVEGWPRQRVLAVAGGGSELLDLSAEPDAEAAFADWFDRRRQRPFRLEQQSWDSVLVRLGPRDLVWYLCLHHLITDAWSFSLLYRQTLSRYLDKAWTPVVDFGEYVEYAAQQRRLPARRGSDLFWKERLARPRERIRFRNRPAHSPYFERRTAVLDGPRLRSLRQAAGAVSDGPGTDQAVAALLMSVVAAYVHRTTGCRALGLGTPVVNRPSRRFRQALGCFMEVASLHLQIRPGETFVSLRDQVRRELLSVLPNTRSCPGNSPRRRAYDVMFNYQTARFEPLLGPTRTEFFTGTAAVAPERRLAALDGGGEYDALVVTAHDFDGGGRLSLTFDLNAAVFDSAAGCDAVVADFLALLDTGLADPNVPIG